MRGLWGAIRLQFQIVTEDRSYLNEIVANPFVAIIFLGVVKAAGRDDLTSFALVAPVLITLWGMALEISGDVVDYDRGTGILEEVVATPTPLPAVVFGRVLTVSALSLVAVAETWAVARFGFGVTVPVEHPVLLVVTLVLTILAMTGTGLIMAAAFVLARSARTYQNTLNYPIYLLSGVLVPLSFLPGWLRPIGRCLFLSWSADLLRGCLRPGPVDGALPALAMVLLLGATGFLVGRALLARVLRHVRQLGTLGFQ
ncbi:MAG: ABC transporter permease [Acidimicrobiales bacterium]